MADPVDDDLSKSQDLNLTRKVVEVIGDAFTFVRSAEANAALATVTLEELINDQIRRNGETSESNGNQFSPYNYSADKETPAGEEAPRANFAGGSDVGRPTKLDFILAIQGELSSVIKEIKANPPPDTAYTDSVEYALVEEPEEL